MKKNSLLFASTSLILALGCLAGCAKTKKSLVVWVGSESVEFYRAQAKEFLKNNADFGLKITIVGADTGSAAGQMVSDNTSCGDIVTIASDNIGKLSQLSYIAPIIDEETIKQVEQDNPTSFISAVKNILGSDDKYTYTFGVPYISQALFLYYDTRYVNPGEEETFEGLEQAAARYDSQNGVSGTKSYTVTGTDGYNFSFSLLAGNIMSGSYESKLRLYQNGNPMDCYAQDNEMVAVLKWMQRSNEAVNGGLLESDSPWATNITNHKAISVIGGAWHYNSFRDAVTDSSGVVHMGCAKIPGFTLTDADVQGIEAVNYPDDPSLPEELRNKVDPAPVAGTKFTGGSFVDCKAFAINMATMDGDVEKYYKICKLLRYFSSEEVQKKSYIEALNVPAFKTASAFVEESKSQVDETAYLMAKSQTGMSANGISQPFSNGNLNAAFYSKGGPGYYLNCVTKKGGSGSDINGIREVLWRMEYLWKNSNAPAQNQYPGTYPASTTK